MKLRPRTLLRKLMGLTPRPTPYTAWLQVSLSDVCNLECHYCISDSPGYPVPKTLGGKSNPADIAKFVRSLDATQHVFKVVFSGGGEPFLTPNIVDLCKALTKRHYVGFCTNLTVKGRIREFADSIDPRRVTSIHASLHLEELERKRAVDTFIESYLLLKERGFPVAAKMVSHPALVDRAEEIRTQFGSRGVEVVFLSYIGEHDGKSYPRDYSDAEHAAFQLADVAEPFSPKGMLCNAGFNVAMVDPSGKVRVCGEIADSLGNVHDGFEFRSTPMVCPENHCNCPYFYFDKRLFGIAQDAAGQAGAAEQAEAKQPRGRLEEL